jgi:hypothetical protein
MYELNDREIDMVAGGQGSGFGLGGLIGAGVGIGSVNVDISDVVDVNNNTVTLNNFLNQNNVQVPIGIAAAVLGISATAVRAIN